ncbi:MAG: flagellar biosynthesis anti-sigma factor FlgM [Burkholderiaceae bacterium]|nr:flagellar biosynthesis anti-sigma factor FlgM [Burkholderiaceae bacterium]
MKIGQKPELPSALAQQVSARQAKAAAPAAEDVAKSAAPAALASGVPVTVSNSARALDRMARSTGDFDANRVKAVKAAIEQGTFKIDAEAIADKLLSGAEEILSRRGQTG